MNLAYKYIEKADFESYEDFCENFKIRVPENFNFAYDIMDEYARLEPGRTALVWCDENGNERRFTFGELKIYSDKTANMLNDAGIRKGDRVMLILRRRYEFYFAAFALAKIGAAYIPCTDQLTEKDIAYRNNAASIRAIIAYNQPEAISRIEAALRESPTVEMLFLVGGQREGWIDFDKRTDGSSGEWSRPVGSCNTANEDPMIIYFTSGTTSMPKMTIHNFTYPLGHIVTAKYWQRVVDGGLHLTLSDSGLGQIRLGKDLWAVDLRSGAICI